MRVRLEWSEDGCRWLVKRLGSTLIYVELTVATSRGRSLLKRSLVLYGKHGRREVFSEEYGLDEALRLHRAEEALLKRLSLHPLPPSSSRLNKPLRR